MGDGQWQTLLECELYLQSTLRSDYQTWCATYHLDMRTGLLLAGSWVSVILSVLPGPVSVYMDLWCEGDDYHLQRRLDKVSCLLLLMLDYNCHKSSNLIGHSKVFGFSNTSVRYLFIVL